MICGWSCIDPQALRHTRPCRARTQEEGDREDVPLDFRYLDLLLRASRDPEVSLGSFAGGASAGPGRLPKTPSTVPSEESKWRLANQEDRENCRETAEKRSSQEAGLSDKAKDVLDDQSRRGQVLKTHRTQSEEAATRSRRGGSRNKPKVQAQWSPHQHAYSSTGPTV